MDASPKTGLEPYRRDSTFSPQPPTSSAVRIAHRRWQILDLVESADGNFPQCLSHGLGIESDQFVSVG
jgi:hypothetical protein